MENKIKLGQVTQVGFGTVMALMVGIGITSKISTNTLVEAVDWVTHTYEVKDKLGGLEKNLVDAETGQRGFIITGRDTFLEPYNKALEIINKDFKEIQKLVQDNPKQLENLANIEDLSQEKISELAETIFLKKAGKETELRALVLSGKGKQVMDNLRDEIGEMIAIENELLDKRKEEAKRAEEISNFISLGGTAAAIGLACFTLWFISKKVVRPINDVTSALASSSTEISTAVEEQERIASNQAVAVNQACATMNELNASARQASEQAEASLESARQLLVLAESSTKGANQVLALAESSTKGANQVLALAESSATGSRQVLSLAASGNQSVIKTVNGMSELKEKVVAIADHILSLSEQTNQIGNISALVTGISNQTNMLALNAAVEAVRAGENSKGFTVIASEIRKLADQSKKSAEKINTLISDIQKSINLTVIVTERGKKDADETIEMSRETAEAFAKVSQAINDVVLESSTNVTQAINDVVLEAYNSVIQAIEEVVLNNQQDSITAINDVVLRSQQISLTAKQQALAIEQVVEVMNNLKQGSVETASGLEQTKIGMQIVNQSALNLNAVV
ncbi:CHASE3 domain-containing protein [Coleofasciculus sp. FACHB-1120]|uniref:CHASE3 domain-containing protein n=1 Tax=Coleofasciculus sp. FACHB-1120 TaxID=2692783 RepID=UPI001689EB37|nr:CHASE3 domain-containing protein [Coleofasciculus sp. FACHB-1120]MBD2743479.1 CHASE3 domain-containing protein [Coleofasciculus sp. FACHB-1120]